MNSVSTTYIRHFEDIRFMAELTPNHPLQKYVNFPKGFYMQKKHIIFVGDRQTGSTTRIKVPTKEVVQIKILSSYET